MAREPLTERRGDRGAGSPAGRRRGRRLVRRPLGRLRRVSGRALAPLRPAGRKGRRAARVSAALACSTLGLKRHVYRYLCDEFSDLLRVRRGTPPRWLTAEQVDLLGKVLDWRRKGLTHAQIREELGLSRARSRVRRTPGVEVIDRLARLSEQLERSEQMRAEERDRLMMALVRTQQEIQHLRYEVAANRSRRERKKSLWRRLFG